SNTTFAGTILARGGLQGGDGGFVETSSKSQLTFNGNVDARAPKGAAGTLLLDPEDFFILSSCDGPCGPNHTTATIIQTQLANQNVVIATNNDPQTSGNGDIFVQTSINWTGNSSLTLSAYRNINIYGFYYNPAVVIANTGAGNLVLRADSTGTGVGTVNFKPTGYESPYYSPGKVDFTTSSGTVAIYYNPTAGETGTKYQNPTNFLCSSPCSDGGVLAGSQLTAYMLVNNASDLQLVSTNLNGTYALGQELQRVGIQRIHSGN